MSSDNVLPMSLEYSVTYVPERFTVGTNWLSAEWRSSQIKTPPITAAATALARTLVLSGRYFLSVSSKHQHIHDKGHMQDFFIWLRYHRYGSILASRMCFLTSFMARKISPSCA